MDNNYIIINKDVLEERIKELEESLKVSESSGDNIRAGIETFEIKALKETLLASLPLIPQLQLVYLAGYNMAKGINKTTCEKYVAQLKLDI